MRRVYIKDQSPTPRDTESIKIYLREIKKIPLITPDEEFELFKQMKLGDASAREKILKHNLRFVVSVAKKYYSHSFVEKTYQFNDLVQQGNIGLVKAIDKWDATKGFKFISYAVFHIQNYLLEFVSSSKSINIPPSIVYELKRLNIKLKRQEILENRILQIEEVIYKMDYSSRKVEQLYYVQYFNEEVNRVKLTDEIPDTLSFYNENSYFSDDEKVENRYLDKIADQCEEDKPGFNLENESLRNNIFRVFHELTSREADVLLLYFGFSGEEISLTAIAERFDLSTERVRQIKEKAIRRLRIQRRANFILSGNEKIKMNLGFRNKIKNFIKHLGSISEELSKEPKIIKSDYPFSISCYCHSCGNDFKTMQNLIDENKAKCSSCNSVEYEINNLKEHVF